MHRSPQGLADAGPGSGPGAETWAETAGEGGADRAHFTASLRAAPAQDEPFRHWLLRDALPADMAQAADGLPFPAPALNGVSGSREINNNTRRYVDADAVAAHPVCRRLAETFQHPATVAAIEAATDARLGGCRLRIEYAQDTEGFWLQPHTDLGVKKFTLLYYLGPVGQPDLGTDVYSDATTWSHRAPFEPGVALAFVPSDRSWHGFEPRPIPVVRKSLIVNYVTEAWRAREQLAYPDRPVAGRRPD